MKPLLKRSIKAALGALGRQRPGLTRILTYHAIGPRRHDMTVSADSFKAQMEFLARTQRVITLEAAVAGEPGVAITFDDGFVDNLTIAAPILSALKLPATVFMVAGRAGNYLDNEPDRAHGRLMDWDQLRQIQQFGIAIGAHTLSHPRLALLPLASQREEIARCKQELEERLGVPITAFAYPYGSARDYTAETMALVQEAGYHFACSNRYGPHLPGASQWEIRRIWIDATDTPSSFIHKVTGRLDALCLLDSPLGLRARQWLNLRDKHK